MPDFSEEQKAGTRAIYERACEIIAMYFHEEARVYEDYSGRAMYGETCDGIVTKASGVVVGAAITEAAYEVFDDLHDLTKVIPRRQDDLGPDTIYY